MTIVGVTGHQDVPVGALSRLRRQLVEALASVNQLVGVSCLAVGADQIFAEAVVNAGGRLRVIVPCVDYETTFSTNDDLERFHDLLALAENTEVLEYPAPTQDAFLAAGKRVADVSEMMIAIWDGEPARGKGGTGDVVRYAREHGTPVNVIWPRGAVRDARRPWETSRAHWERLRPR